MGEHEFDGITLEQLRSSGGLKWSMFPDAIGAFVAEMDFGIAPAVTQAIHSAVERGVFGYLPAALSSEMSSAAAEWQRTAYGWEVLAENVHPIADVIKGLEIAIEHYSRPGSPVILPTPSYMPFLFVPPMLGREVIQVPMALDAGRYTLDLEALERAFAVGGELLILCNPYNPVGRVFERAELLALSELVARNGGRVFSDEIHSPLVFDGSSHVPYASVSAGAAAHTVTATSASKAWNLPGLKCAQFIVSNEVDAEVWQRIGPMASHGASNLGVVANTAAYRDGGEWLGGVLGYLDANRHLLGELLAERLPEVAYTPPQGTYIAWLDCRGLELGESPAEFFREKAGVALTDGIACGEAGAGFVRLVFATPRPILESAIDRMAEALREERSAA